MDPFQLNSTVSTCVSLANEEDWPPLELSIEATSEKLLKVRNRLNAMSERSHALDSEVESLRRLLTAQAHRDGKAALEQLEELRQLRAPFISTNNEKAEEIEDALSGRI